VVPYCLFHRLGVLEGIPDEVRTVRRAKDSDPLDLDHLMLQVDASLLELGDDLFSGQLNNEGHTEHGYLAR
jgi:hypothetical protein